MTHPESIEFEYVRRIPLFTLLAAIIVLLVSPSTSAFAGDEAIGVIVNPRPFDARADFAYSIALSYWEVSAPPLCRSVETVLADALGGTLGSLGQATVPIAPGSPCEIDLVEQPEFVVLCDVATHEVGHLLGHEHDFAGDPSMVMKYPDSVPVPECLAWDRRLRLPMNLARQRDWCRRLESREAIQHRRWGPSNLRHCWTRVHRIAGEINAWRPLSHGLL